MGLAGFKGRDELSGRCRKFGGLFCAKIKHPLNLSCATRARFGDCQNYPLELRWGGLPLGHCSVLSPGAYAVRQAFLPTRLIRPLCPAPWASLPGDDD